MAESVVQIVALAEDLINGVDQFIVIEAFELGFVDIEIFGNDAQNVYRFVIAAVGRIENCVLILLVFYGLPDSQNGQKLISSCSRQYRSPGPARQ